MLDPASPLESLSDLLASPPLPLELRNLAYETGGKRVIDGVDATIDTRSITAIMGPNGAGKSLLLRLNAAGRGHVGVLGRTCGDHPDVRHW